ncbi:type II toxin-antitoxin system HicA family toxin [Geoglobus acetivorans]|uniref:Type II toxin-antitoxin system HicA family toxin n=1 Tax=Geoglobus acetivorans TaxID=565033 RepID=A0ABZ3H6M1_GEOAI|nr:type II toxin-antitoxin system HicA family toxin [Geoglobus acetivorans]
MKLPRDLDGEKLAKLPRKYGYEVTRQTGSHMRLTIHINGEHHITIPKHRPLKPGTLNSILKDVAEHLRISKRELMKELIG